MVDECGLPNVVAYVLVVGYVEEALRGDKLEVREEVLILYHVWEGAYVFKRKEDHVLLVQVGHFHSVNDLDEVINGDDL